MAVETIYEGSQVQLYRDDSKAFRLHDFLGRLLIRDNPLIPVVVSNTCDIFNYANLTINVTYSEKGNIIKASGGEKPSSVLEGLIKKIKEAEIH